MFKSRVGMNKDEWFPGQFQCPTDGAHVESGLYPPALVMIFDHVHSLFRILKFPNAIPTNVIYGPQKGSLRAALRDILSPRLPPPKSIKIENGNP